jgi:hypothetical protein
MEETVEIVTANAAVAAEIALILSHVDLTGKLITLDSQTRRHSFYMI